MAATNKRRRLYSLIDLGMALIHGEGLVKVKAGLASWAEEV
jgi:hypothetical protein